MAVTALSTLSVGSAFAGTTELNVSATVAPVCEFDESSYNNNTPTPTGDSTDIVWYGNIYVTCNNEGNVTISTSEPGATPDLVALQSTPDYQTDFLVIQSGEIWSREFGLTPTVVPQGNLPYMVGIYTQNSIPNGTYGLTFNLTATPN